MSRQTGDVGEKNRQEGKETQKERIIVLSNKYVLKPFICQSRLGFRFYIRKKLKQKSHKHLA